MKSILSLILILLLIGCDPMISEEEIPNVASGDKKQKILMDFELIDLQESMRSSSEWDGSAKLINFWATWCAPCRREIPLLNQTQNGFTDKSIQIIGIAVDDFSEVVSYSETTDFDYPILIGEQEAIAIAENSDVEFIGLPFTMIVTKNNEIIKTHIGEIKEHHIKLITQVLSEIENKTLSIAEAKIQLGSI
jgi:thiol-disulfide isomerase/thioredoxin